jgi:DNA-directed RNA polymerase specialized sigma24 family protein
MLEAIEDGRAHELAADVMRLYATPLEVYFAATSFRSMGSPSDIVAGFFCSRLSQPTWLADWKARHEIDQIPLRRWLLTSLNFYLQEEHRRRQRDGRPEALDPQQPTNLRSEDSAERRFEREAVRAIVREALECVQEACVAVDQAVHLEVFMRHFIRQEPYETVGPTLGLTATQCAGMARTVASKFRRSIGEILLREGADPAELDGEIGRLMEALSE